jgi:hypothetical protein
MIRNIRKNQRVITEITEFTDSPYIEHSKIICSSLDYDTRGETLAGVVCFSINGKCWIRFSNGWPSDVYDSIHEMITINRNTKFYQL